MASVRRVAVLGYGLAGRFFHAPFIAATPGLVLAVIVTGDEERRAQALGDYPGVAVFDTAEEVWSRAAELDLVVVATPNRVHLPHALAGARGRPRGRRRQAAGADRRRGKEARRGSARARADADGLPEPALGRGLPDGEAAARRRRARERAPVRVALRALATGARRAPGASVPRRQAGSSSTSGAISSTRRSGSSAPWRASTRRWTCAGPSAEVDDDVFLALEHASGVRSHLWMSAVAGQRGPRFRVLGNRAAFVKHGLDVQEEALRAGRRPDEPGWGEEPRESWGRLGVEGDLREVQNGARQLRRLLRGRRREPAGRGAAARRPGRRGGGARATRRSPRRLA